MFVSGKSFHLSLMFVGEAYPRVEHLKVASLRYALALPTNIRTRLERLARDKHFSLLQKSVIYGHKKFYSTGPWSLDNKLMGFHSHEQILDLSRKIGYNFKKKHTTFL